MKVISKLSLSDLISGLNYLEEYDKVIDEYLIAAESYNKKVQNIWTPETIEAMSNRLSSIREKKAKYRNEISKRIFTKDEIKSDSNIEKSIKETLIEFAGKRAEAYGLKFNETVPIRVVELILKEAQKAGLTKTTSIDAMRKTLSRLGYGKERKQKDIPRSNDPLPKHSYSGKLNKANQHD